MYLFNAWMFRAFMFAARMFRTASTDVERHDILPTMVQVWHPEPAYMEAKVALVAAVEVNHQVPVFVEVNGVLSMGNLYRTEFIVDSGCIIRALLPNGPTQEIGSYGTPLTLADVGSVSITVTADGTPVSGYNGLAIDPEDVILDTLQGVGDPRFDGANFVYTVPAAAFPTANVMAAILIEVVSTDETIRWPIEVAGRVRETA